MKITIYEINYSVSPGGEDCWAVSSEEANCYEEGFHSAGQALEYALRLYPAQILKVEIRSLKWYFQNYEKEGTNA